MAARAKAVVTSAAAVWIAFGIAGCGGANKKTAQAPQATAQPDAGDDTGASMIPQETLDEIKSTFNTEAGVVSHCFPKAVDAGELKPTDKGYVTVGLTITPDGRPSNLRVLDASLKSKTLQQCVLSHIRGWTFTKLPRSLPYSYTYSFERL